MKLTWKTVSGMIGAAIAGVAIVLSAAMLAYPAISSIAGLAVAQTATQWNNVIDAAKGDAQQSGILGTSTYLFNGLTFDRVRGTSGRMDVAPVGTTTPADAFANPTTALLSFVLPGLFNGTTWDRQDSISATNNTATTSLGVAYHTPLSTWRVIDTDVGATQSTASRAAGGGTVRHVATSITICRGDTAAAVPALINLRDGATGAGTIIRSWVIGISAVNESKCENLSGLNETGTANTAMTLEFAAAGAATSTSTVTLSGYSTP